MKNITKISLFICMLASYQVAYCSEKASRSSSRRTSPLAFQDTDNLSNSIIEAFGSHSQAIDLQSRSSSPEVDINADNVFNDVNSEDGTQIHIATSFSTTTSSPFDPLNPNHIQLNIQHPNHLKQRFFAENDPKKENAAVQTNDTFEASLTEDNLHKQFHDLALSCRAMDIQSMHGQIDNLHCRFEFSETPFEFSRSSSKQNSPESALMSCTGTRIDALLAQHIKNQAEINNEETRAINPTQQNTDKKNATYFTTKNGLISATALVTIATGYWLMRKR